MQVIVLTFRPEDNGPWGELEAEADVNGFAGYSSGWIWKSDIEDFVTALAAFPLPESPAVALRAGELGADHRKSSTVCLTVQPRGSLGRLAVRLELSFYQENSAGVVQTVTVGLLSDYADIDVFRRDLASIVVAGGQVRLRAGRS